MLYFALLIELQTEEVSISLMLMLCCAVLFPFSEKESSQVIFHESVGFLVQDREIRVCQYFVGQIKLFGQHEIVLLDLHDFGFGVEVAD